MNNQIETVKQNIEQTKTVSIHDLIEKHKGALAQALPRHVMIDRLIKIISNVIRYNPAIGKCTQDSLLAAIVQSAQLGLEPNVLGHCWFVPYGGKVQFQIGYKGWMELVDRSRRAVILSCEPVFKNDDFSVTYGTEPKITHNPATTNRGEMIGAYATALHLSANKVLFKYMTVSEINRLRDLSPSAGSDFSPWKKFYMEMALTKPLKALCKMLPKSVELDKAIEYDETIKTTIGDDMLTVPDEMEYKEQPEEMPTVSTKGLQEKLIKE